ncbi:MAG: DNA primase [Nitrospiraceae bacterium]
MSRGLIADAVLAQIKERLDIVDVVSGHVTLTRAGQNFKARCPFHDDRSPSFTVSPSRQLFHCFGCGVSGDVVSFYMKVSGLVFPEAVRELGRRVGVDVPEARGPEADRDAQVRRRLEQMNEAARQLFVETLQDPAVGRPGREYLERRGITPETIAQFQIGYAPREWERLVRTLTAKGFTPAELNQAGLARPNAAEGQAGRRPGWHDYFKERVMFPITDLRRRVVGFGGRSVGDGIPKYLNSQETPLFHKGQTLYGLDLAHDAAGRADHLIIVEGYFDAIALHQAGIRQTVATLGTALTAEHVRMIRRYVKQVVLLFDPDAAGVRAALRSLDLFVDSGLSVTVMSLPWGEDPDTYVRAQGAAAFQTLMSQAPSLWDFALEQSLATVGPNARIEDKVRCADAVLKIVQKIQHPIERDERVHRIAERLGLSETRLREQLTAVKADAGAASSAQSGPSRALPSSASGAANKPVSASRGPRRGEPREEREMVHLLLQGALNAADVTQLLPNLFTVPAYRALVEAALRHRSVDGRIQLRALLDAVADDPEMGPLAAELSLLERHDEDVRASVRGCFESLSRRRWELQLADCMRQLKAASQAGRVEEEALLTAQLDTLRLEKAAGRVGGRDVMKAGAKE